MSQKIVLILTVGGSPEPLKKSILEHKPHYIYFVPSEKTIVHAEKVLEDVGTSISNMIVNKFVVRDPNNLCSCYKACRSVFEDINKLSLEKEQLIVDPTGGTKMMSAAILLAAGDLGIKISYVGGDNRNKDGTGTVITGSEKIIYSAHPFDLVSRPLKEEFCTNFNSYRFEAALEVSRKIAASGSPALQKIFSALAKISEGYRDWDLFRFKSVAHNLEKGLDELRRSSVVYRGDIGSLSSFMRGVNDNLKALSSRNLDDCSYDNVTELVGNARRRAEEGRYDDAVARLYRALEMIAQIEFKNQFKQGTSKFPVEKIPEGTRRRLSLSPNKAGTVNIGCHDAYEILNDIGNEKGQRYKSSESEIRTLLNKRNDSILAHGLVALDKQAFYRMNDIFVKVFGDPQNIIRFAKIDFNEIVDIGLQEGCNE